MEDQLDFVYHAFGGIRNATGNLIWPHAFETMFILRAALTKTGETENLYKLSVTALGHDLLEDTNVTVEQIKERWGEDVAKNIVGLTKDQADKGDQSGYIKKLLKNPEEVWLAKLADIISNVGNSIAIKDTMPPVWRDTFWFPLIRLYQDWYQKLKWIKYPKTGALLTRKCDLSIKQLMGGAK